MQLFDDPNTIISLWLCLNSKVPESEGQTEIDEKLEVDRFGRNISGTKQEV